jgi:L-fuconolactonase
LSDAFISGVRLLGDKALHFDLCLKPTDIVAGAVMIDRCPNTRFVLDHCGNGDVQAEDRAKWEADILDMARRDNVICKISGIVVGAKADTWTAADLAPVILHCTNAFGPERIVFGSDWPVCTLKATYKQWFDALMTIIDDWSDIEKRKLLHDNAVEFYGLGDPLERA